LRILGGRTPPLNLPLSSSEVPDINYFLTLIKHYFCSQFYNYMYTCYLEIIKWTHPFCNLQSRARTHAVLVIGLYELLGKTPGPWNYIYHRDVMGNFFNDGPNILKLIVRVRILFLHIVNTRWMCSLIHICIRRQ
jgi:hypothetical protein